MIYLILFVSMFGGVAVRAFQQINVTHWHWLRIPPTSYLFAVFDTITITRVANLDEHGGAVGLAILAMGTGGWMGCYFSMWLARYLNRRGGCEKL